MYFACSKIVWLPKILAERGFPRQNLIPLHVDNTSAIQITANHVFCEKTKHIATDCHTIREAYDDHIVIFPHVTTYSSSNHKYLHKIFAKESAFLHRQIVVAGIPTSI